jgi:pumilio family protein 6
MLEDAIEDPHASRVLLQLLSPSSRRYFSPSVLEMLHPPQRIVVGTSGNMVTDIEGDEVGGTHAHTHTHTHTHTHARTH